MSMPGRALSLLPPPPPQAARESIINAANTSVIDFFMVEFLSFTSSVVIPSSYGRKDQRRGAPQFWQNFSPLLFTPHLGQKAEVRVSVSGC